jgi:hypothetical protein
MTTKRFYTTWQAEDSIDYRLYIIPSDADYSSGSQDYLLPNDFLLQDMTLDSSIGELPAGLKMDTLNLSVNIASLQGNAELNNLREQLLKGTTTKIVPRNSDGSAYLETITDSYHIAPALSEREFNVFNTFVLMYNDSFGFNPNDWKVLFIGCQKYSAENELEITPLQNLVTFSLELFDITRCIGEVITPIIWKAALRCDSTMITLANGFSKSEKEEYRVYKIGEGYRKEGETFNLADTLEGRFWSYVSTFKRLSEKISVMYSAYMRAILRNNSCSFVAPKFYENTIEFLDNSANVLNSDYLCYVAEIWESTNERGIQLLSGAHSDPAMFGQYNNFHEVLKNLIEGNCEVCKYTYSDTAGNPDIYTCTLSSYYPYGATSVSTKELNQDNTYGNLKVKLLSETLKNATVSVPSINGDADTTEYKFSEQGTSGDNSKDIKVLFHNLPILTNRNRVERVDAIWDNQNRSLVRGSVNSGYILYFNSEVPHVPILVNTICRFYFDADNLVNYYSLPTPIPSPLATTIDYALEIIQRQQNSGLPTTFCFAMVRGLGDKKQAEAELTTTQVNINSFVVGERVKVNLNNYNSLLQSIYNTSIVKGVLLEHSLDIYRGTADIKIRIDAE